MAGGIITTNTHPKALWEGIHAIWGQTQTEHQPEYVYLYDVEDSSKAYEEDLQITGFGLAQVKGETSAFAIDSEAQGVVSRYTHVAYALGYQVSYEELQDNLYEEVSMRRAKANAISMNQTVEVVAAMQYNRAFNPSYTFADGKAMCATDHPLIGGGTGSNALSPAADLSETALEDIYIQILGMTNDRGLLFAAQPKSLIISRHEIANAHRILKSLQQSGTANNDTNFLRDVNAFPDGVHMNHYLTAPHAWFVRTNVPDSLRFLWRNRIEFMQDNDFDTRTLKAFSYMRFSTGMSDWRGIYGSNGP